MHIFESNGIQIGKNGYSIGKINTMLFEIAFSLSIVPLKIHSDSICTLCVQVKQKGAPNYKPSSVPLFFEEQPPGYAFLREFPGGRVYIISPRIARTYPGPSPEVEGLVRTKLLYGTKTLLFLFCYEKINNLSFVCLRFK